MPTYAYFCPDNGQTVEVRHSINEKLSTWGELCQKASLCVGQTSSESPIERKILGGQLMLKKTSGELQYPKKGDPLHQKAHTCGGNCQHG